MDGAYGLEIPVADRVREIIAANALLPVAQVQPAHRLSDLGLDSLGVVEIIFALEETFDISVPFNANDPSQSGFDLSTVGTVIEGVGSLIATR